MVAASVVNIVRYMPVAVATRDSIPIIIRAGLKIIPGPRPLKAANTAPTKEMMIILMRFLGVACKSPSMKLYPASVLSLKSFLIMKTAIPRKVKQMSCRMMKSTQSMESHFCSSSRESSLLSAPLSTEMMIRTMISPQLRPTRDHYKLVLSYSMIALSLSLISGLSSSSFFSKFTSYLFVSYSELFTY